MQTKKSLGQHWLSDKPTLEYIVKAANLYPGETVLEVGPGTGNLTTKLLNQGAKVVAVEKDEVLATKLRNKISDRDFYLHAGDILELDLSTLPTNYKVVANIPYYLTSNLLRVLSESNNPPVKMVLLVQKEVAERICAEPGQMSLLSVSVQLYYQCNLGQVVPAELFMPPPKVDSQVVILNRCSPESTGLHPMRNEEFFRVVKAGFSERRKKLRSSLAGGLGLTKDQTDKILRKASIDGGRRAQELSLNDWHRLSELIK